DLSRAKLEAAQRDAVQGGLDGADVVAETRGVFGYDAEGALPEPLGGGIARRAGPEDGVGITRRAAGLGRSVPLPLGGARGAIAERDAPSERGGSLSEEQGGARGDGHANGRPSGAHAARDAASGPRVGDAPRATAATRDSARP